MVDLQCWGLFYNVRALNIGMQVVSRNRKDQKWLGEKSGVAAICTRASVHVLKHPVWVWEVWERGPSPDDLNVVGAWQGSATALFSRPPLSGKILRVPRNSVQTWSWVQCFPVNWTGPLFPSILLSLFLIPGAHGLEVREKKKGFAQCILM